MDTLLDGPVGNAHLVFAIDEYATIYDVVLKRYPPSPPAGNTAT